MRRHGAIFEALIFGGDTVMLGSMFAGTEETPGEIVQKSVVLPDAQRTVKVPFKVLRGMASIQAIRDRLDVEDADTVDIEALGAEGTEVSVPGARLGAADHPGHPAPPLLVDQLRRRRQPRGDQRDVLEGSVPLPDQAVGVRQTRIVRTLEAALQGSLSHGE